MTKGIKIVSKTNANDIEKFAVNEMAEYLKAITNKQIDIVNFTSDHSIYIGCFPHNAENILSELNGLDDDNFIIKNIRDNIVIYGKTARGTLYGVYDYLNRLGVRFYFPGKENEFIPKVDDVFIKNINVKESPTFNHRSVVLYYWEDGFDNWIDFSAKTKLSAIHLHSDDGIYEMAENVKSRGLDFNVRRHFFGEKYAKDDKNFLEENKALVKDYVNNLPNQINEFFLWPADVTLGLYDNPDNWSIPDVILKFTNDMSTAIREVRPNARMSFLSYWSTWGIPNKIKPIDSVFLEIAHIHQCFSHYIADPLCPVNSKEVADIIDNLLEIFNPLETHVLGYWLDASLFGRGVYQDLSGRLPNTGSIIQKDLIYYKNKGVKNISTFAVDLNKNYFQRFASPNVFLYPMLLWNVNIDIEQELENFCINFYGNRDIAKFFQYTEQIDPRHKDTEQWNSIKQHLSHSETIINDIIKGTTKDIHILRLNRLLDEIHHICKWIDKTMA
ncbi:MAG: DUF4838 domain-containing protein [Candidatus Poribacteria bacterium]